MKGGQSCYNYRTLLPSTCLVSEMELIEQSSLLPKSSYYPQVLLQQSYQRNEMKMIFKGN